MIALLTLLGLAVVFGVVVGALAIGAVWAAWPLRSRGELADADDAYAPVAGCDCEDCDDLMGVADAVAEPDVGGMCLEGFTAEESAVLRANYEPMCDDERIELGVAFESIARREGLAAMVRRVLAERTAQAGGASS